MEIRDVIGELRRTDLELSQRLASVEGLLRLVLLELDTNARVYLRPEDWTPPWRLEQESSKPAAGDTGSQPTLF